MVCPALVPIYDQHLCMEQKGRETHRVYALDVVSASYFEEQRRSLSILSNHSHLHPSAMLLKDPAPGVRSIALADQM